MNASSHPTTTTDAPSLACIQETRRLLGGIGRSTVYELLANGELRSVHIRTRGKLRGRRMILTESIQDYVKRLTVCK